MKYRKLGRTQIKVSEVGLGCEHLQGENGQVIQDVVSHALEHDINILDVFMSEPQVRSHIGRALTGRREKVILQGHIGAAWLDGQYSRTRDINHCRYFFDDFRRRLKTDYVDIGMLHFCDTPEDFQQLIDNGILDYASRLKEQGIIRAVGISSHDPLTAIKAVKTGRIDVLMFSLNPAFDILPESVDIDALFDPESYKQENLIGINPIREELYQVCESSGTAITIMKGYAAGRLLKANLSPFAVALSPVQCIHYALNRPAAASILVGCRTPAEVDAAAAYAKATDAEKDYSVVLSQTQAFSSKGRCMYCNHCLPCPERIDIAQVLKLLDLATAAEDQAAIPATIMAHYQSLPVRASSCTHCGLCENRCPFAVPVIQRMDLANKIFGS